MKKVKLNTGFRNGPATYVTGDVLEVGKDVDAKIAKRLVDRGQAATVKKPSNPGVGKNPVKPPAVTIEKPETTAPAAPVVAPTGGQSDPK